MTTIRLRPHWLTPGRTALLVIDMQVDFALPEGAMGQSGVGLSTVPSALRQAQKLVTRARQAGVRVIFVALRTRPETDSPAWRERIRRLGGDPDRDLALCRANTPGAAFTGPAPAPGETVIEKTRYSAFHGADLDRLLRADGVDTLVLCGLTTESCVDCTARDAFHLDYHVFLAEDACAAYGEALHDGAVAALALNCAIVGPTDAFVAIWGELQPEQRHGSHGRAEGGGL